MIINLIYALFVATYAKRVFETIYLFDKKWKTLKLIPKGEFTELLTLARNIAFCMKEEDSQLPIDPDPRASLIARRQK